MSYVHGGPRSSSSSLRVFLYVGLSLWMALSAGVVLAGGTPDPGTSPLTTDSGDADTLPDNENQLLGVLGADRGFGFGDYVSDGFSGLQSTLGVGARYHYFIEVPPGQTSLVVEIFDADTGAGDLIGTEEHDQNNTTGWDLITEYSLISPGGMPTAAITLDAQDCDPVTVGNQTGCNNAWSDLGVFTVANPPAGHWLLTVFAPDPAPSDEDDNNSFGIRAHDGDASAAGTEYNIYGDTYAGIGHVYGAPGGPALSRTHDLFPYVLRGCACDVNDWDTDDSGDESIALAPQTPSTGATSAYSITALSGATNWRQNIVAGFTSPTDASSYGLWDFRFIVGAFNFITVYMGHEDAADPVVPPSSPGAGAEPNQAQEPGAIRLYMPADGSRFFGERGGADDVIVAPNKPSVGHSWAVISGPDPIVAGATSRVRVTVTVDNPAAFPIQFDATGATKAVAAQVPSNGGQTVFVAGSAAITNGSAAAGSDISVSGAGPWDLTLAPGVVDAGDSITLTYDIDVTPTGLGVLALSGAAATGTTATFFDETCANGTGGTALCPAAAEARATTTFGPLCDLSVNITTTGTPGMTVTKSAGAVTDAGGGQFDVTYTVQVANTGTTNLGSVQVVDNLAAIFTGTATFSVTGGPSTTGTLGANGSYNGSDNANLLVLGGILTPGGTETITYMVRFNPNAEAGPFVNTASGTATDALMNPVADSDTAQVDVPENPAMTVTKTLQGAVVDNMNGTYTASYRVTLANTGNVLLDNVQVVDNLAGVFTAPASFVSATAPVVSGTLAANGSFNGDGDTNLLVAASSTLAVGATETIDYTVTFNPGGTSGPFTNTASGSAQSPLGTNVNDSDTADVSVTAALPVVGLAKLLTGDPVDNMDGTFTASFLFTVENLSTLPLTDVVITDDLSATFPAPASVASVTIPMATGTLVANASFDGSGDIALTTAASTLSVAATAEVSVDVTFDPGGLTTFLNSALVSADSAAGTTTDTSDDGVDPDSDGDANPDEPGENDPTPISLGPIFGIPTMSEIGLLLLGLLLTLSATRILRRQG